LDPQEVARVPAAAAPLALLEEPALFLDVAQPAALAELVEDDFAECEESMSVAARVLEMLLEERSLGPVVPLVLLVDLFTEEAFDEIGEPDLRHREELRGHHRVEEPVDLEREVALQADDVVVGAVENLHEFGMLERLAEPRHVVDLQWIEDVVATRIRDLDEADLLLVVVERVRFGVDSDHGLLAQVVPHLRT